MTDVSAGETPAEPVPPNLAEISARLAPEATAALDAAPPEAPEAVASAEAPAAAPTLPEIEYPIGPMRQAVLDHLIDSVDAGPQSVAQFLAAMPAGTSRNTAESAIKREFDAGRIERVGPGLYVLAPPKPPEAKPAPLPEPVRGDGMTDQQWFDALELWIEDPDTWDRAEIGPRPNEPGRRVPADIVARGVDRSRKRQERRKDAEAASARQEAADRELRDKLKDATGGNFTPGPGIDDLGPIQAAMEFGVPLTDILFAIRYMHHPQSCPKNEVATTWRSAALLKRVAEDYVRFRIVPSLVAAWGAAKAPGGKRTAQAAGDVSTMDTPETSPGKPVQLVEAAPATPPPPDLENAPAAPPANGSAMPDDGSGTDSGGGGSAGHTRALSREHPCIFRAQSPTAPAGSSPARAPASIATPTARAPSGAPGRTRADIG
jgi:hypothetical protein